MLNQQVQFLDVNPLHWRRLFDAVFAKKPEHSLTLLVQNGRIVKAHDSASGLRPEWKSLDSSDPQALAQRLYEAENPDWVQVLDLATLHDYGSAVQTMHDWRGDSDAYLARCFGALSHYPAGLVRYPPWPHELEIAGLGHSALTQLVATVPDGRTLALGVFEGDEIWACIVCRVSGGKIVLVTGTDAFLPLDGRWPHWRETGAEFIAGIERAVGKPYLALLCERNSFEELVATENKLVSLQEFVRRGHVFVYPDVDVLVGGRE